MSTPTNKNEELNEEELQLQRLRRYNSARNNQRIGNNQRFNSNDNTITY